MYMLFSLAKASRAGDFDQKLLQKSRCRLRRHKASASRSAAASAVTAFVEVNTAVSLLPWLSVLLTCNDGFALLFCVG